MPSLALSLIECCPCAQENNDPCQMYKLSLAVDPRRSRVKRWGASGNAIVTQGGELGFELGEIKDHENKIFLKKDKSITHLQLPIQHLL